jgi:hypothetical protein
MHVRLIGQEWVLRQLARIPGVRRLWMKIPIGSVELRTQYDIWERPAYAYGIFSAAKLAKCLGLDGITVAECGVAGGNGLLSMERIAEIIGASLGLRITVLGFDTGTGMPVPEDYRDLPHVWGQGFYQMQPEQLQARLRTAELILGDVAETTRSILAREGLAPVGFIAFDLDYYGSTKKAFQILGGDARTRLPRIYCYFDDITWPEHACHNEFVGELCAIREFNAEHEAQKIAKLAHLAYMRPRRALWNEQIYIFHDFQHPLYTQLITPDDERFRQDRLR